MLVQAGYDVVVAAAGHLERMLRLDTELFERLQAVGDEAGGHDVDAPQLLPSERRQHVCRVRFEPPAAPEPRLERDRPLPGFKPQLAREQSRRVLAIAMVGVAARKGSARHAMERKD